MRIAREGYPLIFTAVILTLLAFLAGWMPLGIILGLIALAVAAFFRDPERQAPAGEGLVVSPADGKVVSVARVAGDSPFQGSADESEHFSFAPRCAYQSHTSGWQDREGTRISAASFWRPTKKKLRERNEQNALSIIDREGRTLGVVQIAGVLGATHYLSRKAGGSSWLVVKDSD